VPQFMDFHDDLKLPDRAIQQITQDTKDKRADEFDVRQVELFHNADGKVYCLLEAPDAEAVRKHHQALGVACGDVHEVAGLL
jgi:Protein of unknown function (DUF4242)